MTRPKRAAQKRGEMLSLEESEPTSSGELKNPSRVNLTIPKDVEGLFAWFRENDPRFKDEPAAHVAAHFLAMGLKVAYQQGLAEAPGYDADEFTQLVEDQRAALNQRMRQISEE